VLSQSHAIVVATHDGRRGSVDLSGDLWSQFTALLYPNRGLIAVIAMVAVVVAVAIASRRGWFRAARRHPLMASVGVIAALAVVLPVGWYLASPLVLSTTIDEPPPGLAAAASASPAAQTPTATPDPSTPLATGSPSASPAATPSPEATSLLERTGGFRGTDDFHFADGTARLIETAPGEYVVRLEDFAVRNGPDLFVYLSPDRNGYHEDAIELARLKADRGNQNYRVPAGVDIDGVASVIIWCRQFSHLFATAPLR
jgi:hypothetical protein